MERLQKVIAQSGYCSRRKAEQLILAGKVEINGEVVNKLGVKVSGKDSISVEGKDINICENKEYYLLNKPEKVISSSSDEKKRKTVVDLIDSKARIYPVGRLDYDTKGLIILTNDGQLTNILSHPKNKVNKTYLAKLDKIIDKDAINALKKGVIVDGRKVKVLNFKVRKKNFKNNTCYVEITIIEGRNHIVKNLFKTLGYTVIKLTRTHYDFLSIDTLAPGEYRRLTIKEVKKLYRN